MAETTVTTRKTKTLQLPPDNKQTLENLFELPADETPDDVAIDNLLSEFQSVESAEVKVYRVMPNNKLAYIYSVHPSEFRFDDLRDIYEGGKFRTFVYGIGEDGRKQLRASPQFDVERPKAKPVYENTQAPQVNNDVANIVAQSMNGLGQLMIQGFENLGKMIVGNQQPQKTTQDMLMEMKLMKDIFSPAQTVAAPVEQQSVTEKMIETLQKGIDLGKSLGEVRGETSSTDILMETIKSFGPVVSQALASNPQPQNVVAQRQAQAAPPIPSVPLVENPSHQSIQENEPDMNLIQQQKLKMGLSFLCDMAEKEGDLQTYAGMAIDTMSDPELDAIFEDKNILEKFAQIEPRINANKQWFESLLNTMRELLTDDSQDDITGGSSSSVIDHAPVITTESDTTGNS